MTDQTEAGAEEGAERVEQAGRKGWKMKDGAILWDDGEKEVPTSGLSDEEKRAEARAAAGFHTQPTKQGVSIEERQAFAGVMAVVNDPEKLLALRKAEAKAAAGKKPGAGDRAAPQTDVEIRSNLRAEAKKLLEREIDRLEELKTLAISGQIELTIDGHPAATTYRSNPPMALHEIILQLLKVAETGSAEAMAAGLETAAAWQTR